MVDFIAAYNEGIAKVNKNAQEEIKEVFAELNKQTFKASGNQSSMFLSEESIYIDGTSGGGFVRDKHVCSLKFTNGRYPIHQGEGIYPNHSIWPIKDKEQLENYLVKLLKEEKIGQIFLDMALHGTIKEQWNKDELEHGDDAYKFWMIKYKDCGWRQMKINDTAPNHCTAHHFEFKRNGVGNG